MTVCTHLVCANDKATSDSIAVADEDTVSRDVAVSIARYRARLSELLPKKKWQDAGSMLQVRYVSASRRALG